MRLEDCGNLRGGWRGWDALGRIRGLRRYLTTAEIDTMRFAQDEGSLLAPLHDAMVLGLTDRWSRMLGDATGLLSDARWFQPFVNAGGEVNQSVNSFSNIASASLGSGVGSAGPGGGSSNSAGGGFGGIGGGVW